jgi:hypothetical protein
MTPPLSCNVLPRRPPFLHPHGRRERRSGFYPQSENCHETPNQILTNREDRIQVELGSRWNPCPARLGGDPLINRRAQHPILEEIMLKTQELDLAIAAPFEAAPSISDLRGSTWRPPHHHQTLFCCWRSTATSSCLPRSLSKTGHCHVPGFSDHRRPKPPYVSSLICAN